MPHTTAEEQMPRFKLKQWRRRQATSRTWSKTRD